MATLVRLEDRRRFVLPSRAIVGRAREAAVRIEDRYASSEHARIQWNGSQWELRDLGSRNGTFVDGKLIDRGAVVALHEGTGLGFGEAGPAWVVEDAAAPVVM